MRAELFTCVFNMSLGVSSKIRATQLGLIGQLFLHRLTQPADIGVLAKKSTDVSNNHKFC